MTETSTIDSFDAPEFNFSYADWTPTGEELCEADSGFEVICGTSGTEVSVEEEPDEPKVIIAWENEEDECHFSIHER